jgi:hypothetical protein
MPGTFAEFMAWPDREEIVLVNVRAWLTLTGWTAVGGGSPNTYQVTLTNRTTPPSGHDTMYRRVVGVRENGTDLTSRSSLANVDANAGSFFWDEAAGVLYVRTTGTAVDPDTKTVVAARVQFFHSTTSVVLNATDGLPDTGRFYEGAISPQTGIVVSQAITDLFAGRSVSMGGELVLANGHRAWLHLVAPDSGYTFKHQQVLFRFGGRYRGQLLDLSQFTTVSTMLIEDITAGETECRIALKPITSWSDVSVPITPYFETAYPNLGDGVRGTYKAILYGRAWTAPALTDTLSYGVWTVADAAYQTLTAVHGVEAVSRSGNVRAVLTEGQDYTVNLTTCTVTVITDRFRHQDWTIKVEATGQPTKHSEAGGAAGMRGYLSTASEIVRDLCHRFAGLKAADLDTAAFDEAHLDAPEELAVYLPSPRSLGSILSTDESGQPSIERSVRAIIGQTRAGLVTMRVWDMTYDAATLPVLTKQDVAAFSPAPRLERLTTQSRVWYARDGRFDTWSKADVVDQSQQYLTGVTTILELWTFLRSTGDADVLAARYQYAERWSTIEVDFVERGTLLALTDVGQRVLVTYDPAPDASGAYTDRAFVLTRSERGYAPRATVQGTLRDAGRLLNRVGRWKGAGEPNYASASAAQRLLSGYWGASTPSSSLGWH